MNENVKNYKAKLDKKNSLEHKKNKLHKIPKEEYERYYINFFKEIDNINLELVLCEESLKFDNQSLEYFSNWLTESENK